MDPERYEPATGLLRTSEVTVLTPPDFVAVLRAGYRSAPHPSVAAARRAAVSAVDEV